eukprot:CAMPEP_0197473734 /NCGR_PEP_ID=MMETSP1309-20131121/5137_1 /TAXON_ID=464262 /ORGANISM="Genus nov. species nov., Strain RCC998" /LENGTH=166 /DNA_ID=CAMNT_0043013025 /DNA_START=248 /DNA_END=749 /DNA_ORIENTATION=+
MDLVVQVDARLEPGEVGHAPWIQRLLQGSALPLHGHQDHEHVDSLAPVHPRTLQGQVLPRLDVSPDVRERLDQLYLPGERIHHPTAPAHQSRRPVVHFRHLELLRNFLLFLLLDGEGRVYHAHAVGGPAVLAASLHAAGEDEEDVPDVPDVEVEGDEDEHVILILS